MKNSLFLRVVRRIYVLVGCMKNSPFLWGCEKITVYVYLHVARSVYFIRFLISDFPLAFGSVKMPTVKKYAKSMDVYLKWCSKELVSDGGY